MEVILREAPPRQCCLVILGWRGQQSSRRTSRRLCKLCIRNLLEGPKEPEDQELPDVIVKFKTNDPIANVYFGQGLCRIGRHAGVMRTRVRGVRERAVDIRYLA